MKKAIVKVKVRDLAEFKRRVQEISLELNPVVYQNDRIYVPRGFKRGMNLPRLVMRTEMTAVDKPAHYYLILKRHIEDSGIEITDRTEVKDYTEVVNIVHQLGFELTEEVSRRRQEIEIGKTAQIYLDKIDKLPGYYVKIETILDEKDKVKEVMEDLQRTLRLFKLGREDLTSQSYFEMIKNK